jgi:nucleoside-diphosphate-sugar epimerase
MTAVLVTGATGFLGHHVVAALAHARIPAHAAGSTAPGITAIVHAAGVVAHTRRDPDAMIQVNVDGALHAVRAAARLGARLILISSSGTVGCFAHAALSADEHAPFADARVARWPYYASKIRAEREATRLAAKLGVELAIVRLPVLLGPGDHRFRSTGHVTRVLTGRVPFVPAGGMHFTDVRDVAAAIVRLAQAPTARAIYHLPGTAGSLASFFAAVGDVSGAPVTTRRAPSWLLHGLARATRHVAIRALPDPVVLEMAACFWGLSTLWSHAELAYAPRPARTTLADTVAWLRAHHPALAASATLSR